MKNQLPNIKVKQQQKKRSKCRIHAGMYLNAALTAVDKHTTKDPTVWLDAVAVAKTKKKLFELIEKKDK